MRNLSCWMLAAGLIVGAGPVHAEGPKLDTTADLVAFCDTDGEVGEIRDGQNFCDGFIAGSGLLFAELVRAGTVKKLTCADPTPTLAQAREAFLVWVADNPDHLTARPIDSLWRAMAETYPCPK